MVVDRMGDQWPLIKVISGGQSGADLAGVKVGKILGYQTGGKMPHKFLTENGYHPEYAELYGMEAIEQGNYQERTRANVMDSHGTILFGNPASVGSRLTMQFCRFHHRPIMVITSDRLDPVTHADLWAFAVDGTRRWIIDRRIGILNVAGNREGTHEGIGARVVDFLMEALKRP